MAADDQFVPEVDRGFIRPYRRVDEVLHDPDGHPVCTWCIQPLDGGGSVRVKRRGRYHMKCYDKHVKPWGGEVEW